MEPITGHNRRNAGEINCPAGGSSLSAPSSHRKLTHERALTARRDCPNQVDCLNARAARVNSILNDPEVRALSEAESRFSRVEVNDNAGHWLTEGGVVADSTA